MKRAKRLWHAFQYVRKTANQKVERDGYKLVGDSLWIYLREYDSLPRWMQKLAIATAVKQKP